MAISEEQKADANSRFDALVKKANLNGLAHTLSSSLAKLARFKDKIPTPLSKLIEDLKLLIGLLGDYIKGDYRDVPWTTVTFIAGAIGYFVMPWEAIPDFTPISGYIDDAYIIKLVLDKVREDLDRYRLWKQDRSDSREIA